MLAADLFFLSYKLGEKALTAQEDFISVCQKTILTGLPCFQLLLRDFFKFHIFFESGPVFCAAQPSGKI